MPGLPKSNASDRSLLRTIVVALTAAFAAAFGITELHNRSDRARQAQISVERLEADATGAAALLLAGDRYTALNGIVSEERRANRAEITKDLQDLDRATGNGGDAKLVRGRMEAFLSASEETRKTGSAITGLLAWRQLSSALTDVEGRAAAATWAARRQATLGMWVILLGAAGIVTLLWRRTGIARRRSDVLEDEVVRDSLTRLHNHAAFQGALASEVDSARAGGDVFALVLGDLDHFKLINDRHGHQVGDRVLVETAERLRHVSRSGDTVARIGGEEFAWILPGADMDVAVASAERLCAVVASGPLAGDVGTSISVGVAVFEPTMNAEQLFTSADAALYEAKHAGRDRVAIARGGRAVTAST